MPETHANDCLFTINFNGKREKAPPSQERLREAFEYKACGDLVHLEGVRAGCAVRGATLADGYRVVSLDSRTHLVHRLIWIMHYGEIPTGLHIDHIDGDAGNNQIENLRLVTPSLNRKNSRLRCDNKSGVVGVYHYPRCPRKPWQATANGKTLGYFATLDEAAAASVAARQGQGFTERHLARRAIRDEGERADV